MMTGMTVTGQITGIYRDYMSFEYKTDNGILTLELPLDTSFSVGDRLVINIDIDKNNT